ncbi:MAG TPA: hypothetical protein VMR37_06530 [Rhabdochlamydiaceae bacterium]|nr:hypothetical protein [Rhabdochlamydiaceae bacterium]
MKVYFLGIFVFFQSLASALYMGNPAEPEIIDTGFFIPQDYCIGVKIGYQGDWAFDRFLRSYQGSSGKIDQFEIMMNQGVITLNYLDRFELYGSVGSMRDHFWYRPKVDKIRREFETHYQWTAGAGARLLLAQWGNTGIGLDGKVQYGKPGIQWITVNGVSHSTGAHLSYCEWQGSVAVYHTLGFFTPYLGAKYSNVHATVDGLSKSVYPHKHFKMTNRCRFGMALGCTLSQGKKVDVNLEVQLIDEQALTFGGNIRF